MSPWVQPRAVPLWVFLAGLALLCLGLTARPQAGGGDDQSPKPAQTLPYTPGFGTSDSNASMIAVTGVDVTGGSVLFLIDTQNRHLSVYQAQGGTTSTSNIKWVGGRNIDLDLKVDGFNDKSEISYKELARRFAESGPSATSGKR